MMKRWWHFLLLGIVALLLFMVARFPAGVAYGLAAQSLPVKFAGLHDTVWDGGAQQLQYRDKVIASTFWQLSPWSLLVGNLDADIQLLNTGADLEARVVVPLGGGEVALSEIKGRLPLPLLQLHLTMIPVPLKGNLSLKLDELLINAEGRPSRAEGRVVWHGAGVQMNEVIPLGDLQVALSSSEEGGITGTLSDSGGPLQLQATLNLKADGSYSLQGTATPNDATPESLRGMLPMLGQPDSQGAYPLKFNGRL